MMLTFANILAVLHLAAWVWGISYVGLVILACCLINAFSYKDRLMANSFERMSDDVVRVSENMVQSNCECEDE